MNICVRFGAAMLVSCLALSARAQSDSIDAELNAIQSQWAIATYDTAHGRAQIQAFDALTKRADNFAKTNPGRAEPLIWKGIVLSTYAGAKGGLGALKLAKQSRDALLAAMAIDPNALDGSAYTSLGALYFKVPGFPIGFGDDAKARDYLQRALAIAPDGIDPNFFYGEFLSEQGERGAALEHFRKALAAPARHGRELADSGRRKEIEAAIAKIEHERVARSR